MPTNCCNSARIYYNIRRYDPIGRTLWVRDYFKGTRGPTTGNCRMIVVANRIYVVGPLCWTNSTDDASYWNLVVYDAFSGETVQRSVIGDLMADALDVATVNDELYALVAAPSVIRPTLVTFDATGTASATVVMSADYEMGPRLVVGNPATTYVQVDPIPAGLLSLGNTALGMAACAVYEPTANDFIVGTPAWTGYDSEILRGPARAGRSLIDVSWNSGCSWQIVDSFAYLGDGARMFTVPNALGLSFDNGFVSASASAPYQVLVSGSPVTLGTGSLVRMDSAGNPVWFRGTTEMQCLATDATGRLYAGSLGTGGDHPSVMRWTLDGDYVWGHLHNAVGSIAIVGDFGSVTIGDRRTYLQNEKNYITEPSA